YTFLSLVPPSLHIYTLSLHDALPIFLQGIQVRFNTTEGDSTFYDSKITVVTTEENRAKQRCDALRTFPSYIRVPVTVSSWPEAKDRKSTRLNSSHVKISYAVFCLKKK